MAHASSEAEIVASELTLQRVLDEGGLLAEPSFAPDPGWRDRLLQPLGLASPATIDPAVLRQVAMAKLRASITVQRRGLTYLIAINARAATPQLAATIANLVAKTYIEHQVQAKIASTLASRDIVQSRIADAGADLIEARVALDSFNALNPAEAELPPARLADLYQLQQNSSLARTLHQTLLARFGDLEAQASLQIADSRIVSDAAPPAQQSFPNARLLLTLAALVALGAGLGTAFVYDRFIGGIVSGHQLHALFGLPVVATIARQKLRRHAELGAVELHDLVVLSPLSGFAEAMRRSRIGIDQALDQAEGPKRGAVVMIASALANEGKSTTALSLARAYAMSGQKTLLIDCDLRKPSIHRLLGVEPSSGLLQYLAGGPGAPQLTEILRVEAQSGLHSVVGARRSDVATDQLLTGKTFRHLLEIARQTFDVIVLDTPPVGVVVDGLYLARLVDAVALVVKWSSTSQRDIKDAVTALDGARRPTTAIVALLNQVDDQRFMAADRYGAYYEA